MSDSSPNVMFSYMYRDAGNFKQYGELVFANPERLPIAIAEETIGRVLIDGQFFEPTEWSVPFIYGFAYDPDLDHSWHEVCELVNTKAMPTDARTLKQFLDELSGSR